MRLAAGAGFVVVICGNIMTMPGLPKKPAAVGIDVDADGRLIVRTDSGEEKVFTGEVSVHGIYGAV